MGIKDSIFGRLLGSSESFSAEQVAQALELLIKQGVERQASSIHIEPHADFLLVRYRIGTGLRGVHKLPQAAAEALIHQLKKQSGLDSKTTHMAQHGHFDTQVKNHLVAVEVSIVPVVNGEKVVLHIAVQNQESLELEKLGFWGDNLIRVRQALARPQGLLITAGPRRAGVSTTLHTLLQLSATPATSVATVESQIKHQVPGATQTHVRPHKNQSMSQALRDVLRQDPDIVLIDRVADTTTARLALEGAQQGHLMLAGVFAGGAIDGLLHLRALGVEPFMLVRNARISIGQRLVRQLCPYCKIRYELHHTTLQKLETTLGLTTHNKRRRIHELERQAQRSGLGSAPLGSNEAGITHLCRASKDGCDHCDHTGYQGHIALTEVLPLTEPLLKMLGDTTPPTLADFHAAALKDGFMPMMLDGLIKSLRGLTTTEDVLRLTT